MRVPTCGLLFNKSPLRYCMPTERKHREGIVRYGRMLHERGFVAAMEHNPQKSRVLLRLALLKSRTNADLQRLFAEY